MGFKIVLGFKRVPNNIFGNSTSLLEKLEVVLSALSFLNQQLTMFEEYLTDFAYYMIIFFKDVLVEVT